MINKIITDIQSFLENNNELLFNERDLQMHLASHLRETKFYDDVDVEYYVPHEELVNYVWESELKLDIVVKKNSKYYPIELKYKTKTVKEASEILRFDESIQKSKPILKNQGAQDLGMYDFWKDVRRVELVKKRFKNVESGVSVFVTNDKAYLNKTKESSNNYQFDMSEGKHLNSRHWQNSNSTCARTHRDFDLDSNYTINWNNVVYESITFYYTILKI
ncbi:MAG: hypothetical protein MJ198_08485 [Bacteroidales bacterium]|nr:hypothetical protein [Bacteroidales bacterium]